MDSTAYLARLPRLPESPDGLESIQLFPPGKHEVVVTNAKGEPVSLTVTVGPETAATLEAVRARYQAEADEGRGDAPYLDFNHQDGEAAAWVRAIRWAGDDPVGGGVRAEVELTAAGRAAIEGRTYRRFSPAFHADPATGAITGAPANMGGLVNRAAFRSIAPLFAKATNEEPDTMTTEEITALQEENAALKSQLAELQAQLETLTMQARAAAETEAAALVARAAAEGRIPPGEEIRAKWTATIVADPSAKELLAALAPHPALTAKSVIQAKPDGKDAPPPTVREVFRANLAALRGQN